MQDHAVSKAEAQGATVMALSFARMIDRMGGWDDDGQELLTDDEARQADELQRRAPDLLMAAEAKGVLPEQVAAMNVMEASALLADYVRLRGALCAPWRRARPRGRAAPRRRRTSSSSRTSGSDPGDDGEPPPRRLAVAPPPRATLSYRHRSADQRGEAS